MEAEEQRDYNVRESVNEYFQAQESSRSAMVVSDLHGGAESRADKNKHVIF